MLIVTVNDFDLDGNAGLFDNIRKGVQNAGAWAWKNREGIAFAASIALTFVPVVGPAVGVARVAMYAYKVASVAKVGRAVMGSSKIGLQSAKFGSKSFGKVEGTLNRAGSKMKIGWDKHNGANYFRIGIGKKPVYNVNRAKTVVYSKYHINILRFRH